MRKIMIGYGEDGENWITDTALTDIKDIIAEFRKEVDPEGMSEIHVIYELKDLMPEDKSVLDLPDTTTSRLDKFVVDGLPKWWYGNIMSGKS
jgi:hypothetical protein